MAKTASIGEARQRLPREFLESLQQTFPQAVSQAIIRGMCARRPTTFRVNTLQADPREIVGFLRETGVKFRAVPWSRHAFILSELRERDVEQWDWYREGRLYLQSLSSMVPAIALAPRPGERVLDLAAAPGGKTTQMAALMENSGSILAVEPDEVRLSRLSYNVALQGCRNVEVRKARGERIGGEMPGAFDRVLLDVPCSGEGRFIVGAPGTSRAWSRKLIADRARLQRKLFESGFHAVRPGGVLVYSTCTLNLEENEKVIHWALESFALETEKLPLSIPGSWSGISRGLHPGVSNALRLFPDAEKEGFFICRLRRVE
ncbi:MAG: RsmB/NOP family class I SAM-dependent RNA methyltransferase [Spirochaetia bacterium]